MNLLPTVLNAIKVFFTINASTFPSQISHLKYEIFFWFYRVYILFSCLAFMKVCASSTNCSHLKKWSFLWWWIKCQISWCTSWGAKTRTSNKWRSQDSKLKMLWLEISWNLPNGSTSRKTRWNDTAQAMRMKFILTLLFCRLLMPWKMESFPVLFWCVLALALLKLPKIMTKSGMPLWPDWRHAYPTSYEVINIILLHLFDAHVVYFSVHIYQGADLPAADSNGLLDPYIKVNFLGFDMKKTVIRKKTRFPLYYTTITFDCELPDREFLPQCNLQLYDYDQADITGDDYMVSRH